MGSGLPGFSLLASSLRRPTLPCRNVRFVCCSLCHCFDHIPSLPMWAPTMLLLCACHPESSSRCTVSRRLDGLCHWACCLPGVVTEKANFAMPECAVSGLLTLPSLCLHCSLVNYGLHLDRFFLGKESRVRYSRDFSGFFHKQES